MAYNGTFIESWPSKFDNQHGIKVQTDKGDFKLWGRGPVVQIAKGTKVSFEAKKGKGDSWYYSDLKTQGGRSGTAPVPQTNDSTARMIYITGIVGRAMGSGQFGVSDIKLLTLAAKEAFDALDDDGTPSAQGEEDYGSADPEAPPF